MADEKVIASKDKLDNIADSIRFKTGETDEMTLDEMPEQIRSIEGSGGYYTGVYPIEIDENGQISCPEVLNIKGDLEASSFSLADLPVPEGAWIRYSNGEKVISSATRLYIFTGTLPKAIHAFLASDTNVLCAIAFYSSVGIDTSSYLDDDSVDFLSGTYNDGAWYSAIVPSTCKTIAITTKVPSASVAEAKILFSNDYRIDEAESDISVLKNMAFNAKQYCNINGYIDNGGFFNSNANYRCSDYIPIKSGDTIEYTLSNNTTLPIIAVYDSSKTYVSAKTIKGINGYSSGTFTADASGFVRIIYSALKANVGAIFTSNIPDNIAKGLKDASFEASEIYKKVYAVNTDNTSSGFIDASGAFVSNALYTTTDYIHINNGESFSYKLSHGATIPIVAYYDLNKIYDGSKSVNGIAGYSEGTYTATSEGYVRFTYLNSKGNVRVIFTDTIPDNVKKAFPSNEVPSLNILCLGDSIFGEDDDITEALSFLSGATVINGAVGGTRATNRGGSHGFKDFDGVNLIQALCTNTWTNQEAGAEALVGSYPWITSKLATLKSVDMSKIDLITFNWATNDYTASISMADIITAHNTIIDTIQTYYPTIKIVVITPIWRYFGAKSDNQNADNYAYNVNTLKEISNSILQNAQDKRITVFDAYKNIPLNYNTCDSYFNTGSDVHLNAVGGKMFAHYLNGFINSIY